jgi:hypothetical protein
MFYYSRVSGDTTTGILFQAYTRTITGMELNRKLLQFQSC